VDESYILVDEDTTDNTIKICENRGCKIKTYKFYNFAKTWNTLLNWINPVTDWGIFIAPDETINERLGKNIQALVDKMNVSDADGAWFPRRHWEDLEKNVEYTGFNSYPDWQLRLIRIDYPRIHLKRYVHELPMGIGRTLRIKEDINHFNVYWKNRIDYDMDAMYKLYNKLKIKEIEESGKNIWP
jgi:hypothetical protein